MDMVQSAQSTLRQREVSKYILAEMPCGGRIYAHPSRVLDGILLPEGDRSGNGVPALAPEIEIEMETDEPRKSLQEMVEELRRSKQLEN